VRLFGRVAAALVVWIACATTTAQAFDHAGLARRTLENHIIPGYARFAEATAAFAAQSAALCEPPSAEALSKTRDAAREALLAWGRIEHIRFGPITADKRFDRLMFYPDPRGIARKQIARLLRRRDRDDIRPAKLASASVAVQGFAAIDRLLYGKGSDALATSGKAAAFRCQYVKALAQALHGIAADTLRDWSGPYRNTWLHPGKGNGAFLTPEEVTQALLRSYVTGLEVMRLQRLAPVIGTAGRGEGDAADPLLAQSGLGAAFLIANVEGIRGLLTESGFVDPALTKTDAERTAAGVLESVITDLGFAVRAGETATKTAPNAFADKDARAQLAPMLYSLKNSEETGRAALGALTGSMLGFNSLDGD
jgi:uncharacterized protein